MKRGNLDLHGGQFHIRGSLQGAMADPPEEFGLLPSEFAATGDPVDGNPYPAANPRHARWAEITRIAEAKVSGINSHHLALPVSTDETEVAARMIALIVAKYDVWAERGLNVVWSDPEIRLFDRWLVNYANSWLVMARDHAPPFVPLDAFLGPLRMSLARRLEYWKAEARRYVASATEVQIQATQSSETPEAPSDLTVPAPTERQHLLLEFKGKAKALGVRVTDEMIAKTANPGKWNDRTMVTWWKRCDVRCGDAQDKKIRAVLAKDPAALWPGR